MIEWGDELRVLAGPFKGFIATVRDTAGDLVECEVKIFGRTTTLQLPAEHLGPMTLIEDEVREIEDAVAHTAQFNAPHAFRRTAWLLDRLREGVEDSDLPRLDRELLEVDAEMDEADQPHIDEALAKFRAAFAAVPPEERAAWWAAHRGTWTASNDGFRAFVNARFGEHMTAEDARAALAPTAELRNRIEQSRHAGYVNDLDGTEPIAVDPALEAAIAAKPDDDATWIVYGDWLQAHGDPRGELVARHGSKRMVDRFVARHERYFLGGLARHWEIVTYTWRRGFLRTAQVVTKRAHEDAGIDQAALVRTLVALPSAKFLEELTLGAASVHETGVADAVVDALVWAGPRPTLRKLVLGTDQNEEMLSWTETGALERIWPLTPNLVAIDLCAGNISIGILDLPRLARLRIETCYLTAEHLAAFAASKLPMLRSLELWFGQTPLLAETMTLVDSPVLAAVTELGLVNTTFTDELAEALARSSRLASLELLDLSRGTLGDAGALAIARAASDGRAPRLRVIDIHECYVTENGIAALRATGLAIRAAQQRTPDDDGSRYCAVAE